jgi:hypothetical protein
MYKAGTVEVEHLPCLDVMLPGKEFALRLELSRPFQRGEISATCCADTEFIRLVG